MKLRARAELVRRMSVAPKDAECLRMEALLDAAVVAMRILPDELGMQFARMIIDLPPGLPADVSHAELAAVLGTRWQIQ